jgi:hypothetical protein
MLCAPCETLELGGRGQNPFGVGSCITLALSQTATRNAAPALPGFIATVDDCGIHASPPMSSLFHLFIGARLQQTDAWISLVTAYFRCQARHGLGPRGVPAPLAIAQRLVAYRRDKTVGTRQPKLSGLNTFRVGITRYLCTSPAYLAYASTRTLPVAPHGSILGSRLTITQAGLAPARIRVLARPHCPRNCR